MKNVNTNKNYTIKYLNKLKLNKTNRCNKHHFENSKCNSHHFETTLATNHPLIKSGIKRAVAICLTFTLIISGVSFAQAYNSSKDENMSKLGYTTEKKEFETTDTSPHILAINAFEKAADNYWDLSQIGEDRIFYVDMSVADYEEFKFNLVHYGVVNSSDMSPSDMSPSDTNSSDMNSQENTKPQYRYAGLIHLTDAERHVVESIVAGESGGQPLVGKKLVAQAIYNAMLRSNISPFQVRKEYRYSGYTDIDEWERQCLKAYGNSTLADECRQAVREVFDEYDMPVDDFVLYFYAPKVTKSKWHESLKPISYTDENGNTTNHIGGHKFFSLWDEPVINYTREG